MPSRAPLIAPRIAAVTALSGVLVCLKPTTLMEIDGCTAFAAAIAWATSLAVTWRLPERASRSLLASLTEHWRTATSSAA